MSLRVLSNPDRATWNAFVASHPEANIFQSYEWGQIRQAQGWDPHYVAVAEGARWVGAALVLVKRLPGGVGALLYSPCGPLVAEAAAHTLPMLVQAVHEIARRVGGIFWRIEPRVRAGDAEGSALIEQMGFRRLSQEWSYWNRPKYDMHLPIGDGEAAVFTRISSRTRGKIRYAPKRGVVVNVGQGDRDVEIFYRLLTNTASKKRIPVRDMDYFTSLYWTLEKAGIGRLFIARKGDEPVAAGISSRIGKVGSLLYLSNDYSVKYAGWAVQWEMLRWAISEGCQVYDLAGTATNYPPRETDEGYGVYQFKRSFGAEIVAWYGYADYVFRPASYRLFRGIEHSLPYGKRWLLDGPLKTLRKLRSLRSASRSTAAENSDQ